jgi:phospholipid-transporting ATPase
MGLRSGRQCWARDQVDAERNVRPAVNLADISDAPIKRTAVERQVNMQILYLFILLLVLSLISTVGNSIRTVSLSQSQLISSGSMMRILGILSSASMPQIEVCILLDRLDHAHYSAQQFVENILTSIILYNNLIPISYVTREY